MAFADPTTITLNSVANTLNKIKEVGLSTLYSSADQNLQLELSHQPLKNGRIRTLARLVQRKVVTNPLDSTQDYDTVTVNATIDRPGYGWTAAEIGYLVGGLTAFLSSANVTKLYELQH
jgi:hypothetical protein